MAALPTFHGIRAGQLHRLQLDDGRVIALGTHINPRLFIHQRCAHVGPVASRWLALRMSPTARALRDDRMLDESHAIGGDVRRPIDLFGVPLRPHPLQRHRSHPALEE